MLDTYPGASVCHEEKRKASSLTNRLIAEYETSKHPQNLKNVKLRHGKNLSYN